MRLSDLRDKKIRGLDGERLGRVHEVHCDQGQVVALKCGPGSLIERWTDRSKGRRVPWEAVVRVERDQIIVSLDRSNKPSAARTRPGTRPASAPRSRR
jgi:sporulation protein YlmC with PRC-barrel domain